MIFGITMNRRTRRNQTRRPRRNNGNLRGFHIYQESHYRTVAATNTTVDNLSRDDVLNDFDPLVSKQFIIRSFKIVFDPTLVLSEDNTPFHVQAAYIPVSTVGSTSFSVNMTALKPLSVTNRTTLSFTMPFNIAESRQTSSNFEIFAIRFFSPRNLLAPVTLSYQYSTTVWLCPDTPTIS